MLLRHFHFLLPVLLLAACGGSDDAQKAALQQQLQQEADSLALKIAVTPTADCEPLYFAEREGWFEREGLSVRLVPFQAQMDQDTAIARQRVEGMTTDRERLTWLNDHGVKLVEVAQTSLCWQLITNKDARIRQLPQLDDKMIAMTRYSATDRLAQMIVDMAGLAPERVFRIQINDVDLRLRMLLGGMIDAVLLPEPQATVARQAGHPSLLSTDSLDLHFGVIAFRQDVMDDSLRRQQVEKFIEIYHTAADSLAQTAATPLTEVAVPATESADPR